MRTRKLDKDHYAAALLILIGAGVVTEGAGYRIGSLTQMGAGFIPVVLGVLLLLMGLAIGLTGRSSAKSPDIAVPSAHGPGHVDVRGWLCILGGVFAFVLFGHYGGLAPATFASVFVAALGDRNNSVKDAALLALGLVVAGAIIFSWGLRMQLPLFTWGH
jgi:hypothetical protein